MSLVSDDYAKKVNYFMDTDGMLTHLSNVHP